MQIIFASKIHCLLDAKSGEQLSDKKQAIYIDAKYHLTKYLLITKEEC